MIIRAVVRRAALLVFALGLSAGPAAAATITFEGYGNAFDVVEVVDDFTFTFNAAGWGIITNTYGPGFDFSQNGTTRLVASGDRDGTASVLFQRTDLATFSLNGFDGATAFNDFTGRIEVIGNLSGGGTVSAFFDLTDAFTAFALPNTFTNLTSVVVRDTHSTLFQGNPGSFAFDNVTYDVATAPEPASMLLLGTGLLGAGVRRWRQKRA